MVAKPPGAGYTRHLYTAKWTPAACKYWNHWRPLEPNSSSLVVFHSYRWSLAPPGYYQLTSHYSLHWFQTPGSTSIWIRIQHWASSRLNVARFLFSVIWSLHITFKLNRQSYESKHLKLSAATGVLCLSIFASNSFRDNLHERLQEGANKSPVYQTQFRSLPCLVTKPPSHCSCWILFKLFKVVTGISLCYQMDVSKFISGFLWVVTWICQSC